MKARVDPHDWQRTSAFLRLADGRCLKEYELWICSRCSHWTMERPELLHTLPPCAPVVHLDAEGRPQRAP